MPEKPKNSQALANPLQSKSKAQAPLLKVFASDGESDEGISMSSSSQRFDHPKLVRVASKS